MPTTAAPYSTDDSRALRAMRPSTRRRGLEPLRMDIRCRLLHMALTREVDVALPPPASPDEKSTPRFLSALTGRG
eukprot:8842559-Pyramimonas_sp.AAC.1